MTTRIAEGSALSACWYQQVEVEGRYEAMRVKRPGGGSGAIAVLGVASAQGTVYIDLFDRSEDEAARLEGKVVVVAGQLQPPVDGERPLHAAARDDLPALVSITSITEAGGHDASDR